MPMIAELDGSPEQSEIEIIDAQLAADGESPADSPGGQNGTNATVTVEDPPQSTVTTSTASPDTTRSTPTSSPTDASNLADTTTLPDSGRGTVDTGAPGTTNDQGAAGSADGSNNGSAPTPSDWNSRIEQMSDEELENLQQQIDSGDIPVVAPPSEDDDDPEARIQGSVDSDNPAPAPPHQQQQAPVTQEQQPQSPAPEGSTSSDTDNNDAATAAGLEKPQRFRLKPKSELDGEVFKILKNNPDLELEDALPIARKRLGIAEPATTPAPATLADSPADGTTSTGEGSQPPSDAEPSANGLPGSVSEARAALATAREARDKAQFEDFDADEARKQQALVDQLSDHISDLRVQAEREAEEQEAAAQREEQEVQEQFHASSREAARLYPSAAVEGSQFAQRMYAIDQAMLKSGDPLANSPEKPLRIAQMVAAEMGIAPSTAGPAPAAPSSSPKPTATTTPQTTTSSPPAPIPASGAARTQPAPNGGSAMLQRIDQVEDVDDLNDLEAELRSKGLY